MTIDYRAQLEVAERVAREAGLLLIDMFGKVTAREKGPSDLVTEADLASQDRIARLLASAFPDHTLLAEEAGVVPAEGNPWRWIVDPLDGTVNFAHGNPLWCVSIGLEHAGELVVGVVHQPMLGTTHAAARGLGATLNGEPIQVSATARLADALTVAGMPTDFTRDAERQLDFMGRFSHGTHGFRRIGCSAWNLATLAAGGFDVCYATAMNPWDAAAGVVIVREAGGTVTALDGSPYDVYQPGILATNSRLHDQALHLFKHRTDA